MNPTLKIKIHRCRECGARGLGPGAVKLLPMNGVLYCREHWREALVWEEQRASVLRGLSSLVGFHRDVHRTRWAKPRQAPAVRWEVYILELSEMARWALKAGDRRTFVHYF